MAVQGTGNFDVELNGRKRNDLAILLVPDETMRMLAVIQILWKLETWLNKFDQNEPMWVLVIKMMRYFYITNQM